MNRKVTARGHLFVAPESLDFSFSTHRNRRWQRRWFILFSNGELTYALDDNPETLPQKSIDMTACVAIADAVTVTGHAHSFILVAIDNNRPRISYIKGNTASESDRWRKVFMLYVDRNRQSDELPIRRVSEPYNTDIALHRNTSRSTKQQRRNSGRTLKSASDLFPTNISERYQGTGHCLEEMIQSIDTSNMSAERESVTQLTARRGWLMLRGETDLEWGRHWAVLTGPSFRLFRDFLTENTNEPILDINLIDCDRVFPTASTRNYGIEIRCAHNRHVFSALTPDIRDSWITALQNNMTFVRDRVGFSFITVNASNDYASTPPMKRIAFIASEPHDNGSYHESECSILSTESDSDPNLTQRSISPGPQMSFVSFLKERSMIRINRQLKCPDGNLCGEKTAHEIRLQNHKTQVESFRDQSHETTSCLDEKQCENERLYSRLQLTDSASETDNVILQQVEMPRRRQKMAGLIALLKSQLGLFSRLELVDDLEEYRRRLDEVIVAVIAIETDQDDIETLMNRARSAQDQLIRFIDDSRHLFPFFSQTNDESQLICRDMAAELAVFLAKKYGDLKGLIGQSARLNEALMEVMSTELVLMAEMANLLESGADRRRLECAIKLQEMRGLMLNLMSIDRVVDTFVKENGRDMRSIVSDLTLNVFATLVGRVNSVIKQTTDLATNTCPSPINGLQRPLLTSQQAGRCLVHFVDIDSATLETRLKSQLMFTFGQLQEDSRRKACNPNHSRKTITFARDLVMKLGEKVAIKIDDCLTTLNHMDGMEMEAKSDSFGRSVRAFWNRLRRTATGNNHSLQAIPQSQLAFLDDVVEKHIDEHRGRTNDEFSESALVVLMAVVQGSMSWCNQRFADESQLTNCAVPLLEIRNLSSTVSSSNSLFDSCVDNAELNAIAQLYEPITGSLFTQSCIDASVKLAVHLQLASSKDCTVDMPNNGEIGRLQKLHKEDLANLQTQCQLLREAVVQEENRRKKLQDDFETMKTINDRNLENLHQMNDQLVQNLRDHFASEINDLRAEHAKHLDEEKAATRSALDALQRSHENELKNHLEREKCRMNGQLNKESSLMLEQMSRQLFQLSSAYSAKCLENARLDEKLADLVTSRDIRAQCNGDKDQYTKRNFCRNNSGTIEGLRKQFDKRTNGEQLVSNGDKTADSNRNKVEMTKPQVCRRKGIRYHSSPMVNSGVPWSRTEEQKSQTQDQHCRTAPSAVFRTSLTVPVSERCKFFETVSNRC